MLTAQTISTASFNGRVWVSLTKDVCKPGGNTRFWKLYATYKGGRGLDNFKRMPS